jgi:hypothetical protein
MDLVSRDEQNSWCKGSHFQSCFAKKRRAELGFRLEYCWWNTDSRRVMAEDKSDMSMMEYSGDFGGIGGGCQRFKLRRFDSRARSRVSRGVRWACMSADDGSRVSMTMPVDMSCACSRSDHTMLRQVLKVILPGLQVVVLKARYRCTHLLGRY